MKPSKRTYVIVAFDSFEEADEFYENCNEGQSVSLTDNKQHRKILAAIDEDCKENPE